MHGNVEVYLYKIFSLSDSWQLGERTAVFIFMTRGGILLPKKGIAARLNYKFVVFLVQDFVQSTNMSYKVVAGVVGCSL
jgi:hypothetical protein